MSMTNGENCVAIDGHRPAVTVPPFKDEEKGKVEASRGWGKNGTMGEGQEIQGSFAATDALAFVRM